ncbi:MAG: hypothetical protein ACXVZX_04515 [Terriglobales bacterium]
MNHDGITVTAMLLLAAFAVDRLSSGITFLAFRPKARPAKPDDQDRRAWNQKLIYFAVVSVIAIAILIATDKIRLLEAMGMLQDRMTPKDRLIDVGLTFLVLVGGAERISALLGSSAPPVEDTTQAPVKLEGTLSVASSSDAPVKVRAAHE